MLALNLTVSAKVAKLGGTTVKTAPSPMFWHLSDPWPVSQSCSRACMRACARARVCVCVCVCTRVSFFLKTLILHSLSLGFSRQSGHWRVVLLTWRMASRYRKQSFKAEDQAQNWPSVTSTYSIGQNSVKV